VLENLFEHMSLVAGSSICAAKCLTMNMCDAAVNWFGGWHHAQRDQASGFCYVNDIVLAIHELAKVHKRVLYVDLDVHHGMSVDATLS
jgi:acetoin utilization deacetylase AcuC-like enzyme